MRGDFYPLWMRLWHWLQALTFIGLLVTGLMLHYASGERGWLSFGQVILAHNVCGAAATILWAIFVAFSIRTGYWRQYLPRSRTVLKDAWRQLRFYAWDYFQGASSPFERSDEHRFNPAQLLAYLTTMYFLMPLVIFSGTLLFFPELAPARVLQGSGIWPMALLHLVTGYLLTLFLVIHAYMATTGATPLARIREMITGRREVEGDMGRRSQPPPPPPG